jgi:alpha-glucosidase (family GH31 glycosyl hydrolase)
LKAIGIKNTAYFNAMLESSYTELYNVAAENGYFVKTKEGLPYNYSYIGASSFYVSQVDYTNALAVKWYQTQLQGAVDVGFHGWMYDYGEYTPPDSVSSDGTIGLEMHNKFPLLYQKTAFDFFKKFDKNTSDPYAPDYVFYVRSSYTGSQRYTWAHWTGDPSSDWSFASGLPAQITASLNIGLSGMPFSGSDIGGFEWYVDRVPDLELWVRWTQAGCFSGLMHEQGGGKGHGSKSHIFDWPEGTRIWRKYAKLRMQLFPYIYTQAHTAHQNGMPIMRQHILSFPDDVQAIRQAQQYMFGESFLAAPVVRQGAVEWDVYLPTHGSGLGPAWLDVGSTMQYDESDGRFRIGFSGYFEGGKTVRVSASLDVSPLFVLAGTITPASDPRIMSLNNATDPHVVTWQQLKNISYLWVWADASFSASGHSFMGYTYSMEKSQSVKDVVEFAISGPKGTTHITQISADWKGKPKNVYTEQNLPFVTSWKDIVASTSASCWSFDDAQKVVWVRTSGEEFSFKIEKAS